VKWSEVFVGGIMISYSRLFSICGILLLITIVKSAVNTNSTKQDDTSRSSSSSSGSSNPFVQLLGPTLYTWKNEEEAAEMSTIDLLQDKKIIALYFSASWCGPCRQFTPILVDFYKRMNEKKKKFEVIFISKDQSAEQFGAYYSKMPWLAVPLPVVQQIQAALSSKYQVMYTSINYYNV
jgi:thiol-disulfide isomerase/thioredoxin